MKPLTSFMDRLLHAISVREGELGTRILKKDLAKAAKVSSSAVTLWYSGSTEQLKAESLFGLARYLKVRPEWLRDDAGAMRDGTLATEAADPNETTISSSAQAAIDAIRDADFAGVPEEVFWAIQALVTSIPRPEKKVKDGRQPHLQA
ncbi:helix-turn-helix domain-containing protein [Burkholderia gladioli]|uniref:helix-turn-helix domain-containing protein n=1 Tax=Burkholderia gladioli TaxID=28095 RepID=UPI001C263699|nr:helix-turn-helix domain-containing protein [Burkholderia gladioli]MBU9382078.1 helix-turn-helix domain-containing protein [Burkholderia gladioli]